MLIAPILARRVTPQFRVIRCSSCPSLRGKSFSDVDTVLISSKIDTYHLSFPGDKRAVKALGAQLFCKPGIELNSPPTVYAIFALETLQVCLGAADIYYWCGEGYGNMRHLGSTYLSSFDTPMLGAIIAFSIQVFFCYRIWTLRRSYWPLCILITCVSLAFKSSSVVRVTSVRFTDSHSPVIWRNCGRNSSMDDQI